MRLTKRQLKRIIKEEYRKIMNESIKGIATEMLNYLDHLLRELEMKNQLGDYGSGAFDATDVVKFIQADASGNGIIFDYFPESSHADFVLSSDANEISAILDDMLNAGMLEDAGQGTTKKQGRYWRVYYLVDFPDHSPQLMSR